MEVAIALTEENDKLRRELEAAKITSEGNEAPSSDGNEGNYVFVTSTPCIKLFLRLCCNGEGEVEALKEENQNLKSMQKHAEDDHADAQRRMEEELSALKAELALAQEQAKEALTTAVEV